MSVTTIINSINWNNKYQHLRPSLFQRERIVRATGKAFRLLSIAILGASVILSFATTPLYFIPGCILYIAISNIATGLLNPRKEFWNDPQYRINKGKDFVREAVTQKWSKQKIQTENSKHNLLSEDDINAIINSITPPTENPELSFGEPPEELELTCPISFKLFEDPVRIIDDPTNTIYSRSAIEKWIKKAGTNPMTKAKITLDDLAPDAEKAEAVAKWLEEQKRKANALKK